VMRSLVWRRLDLPGAEYFELRQADGWSLEGTCVLADEGGPSQASYTISLRDDWSTERVEAFVRDGNGERSIQLEADGERRWFEGDKEVPGLRGCVDVDLGVTPSTNTLPIRRLNLAVGETRAIDAAWVRFPNLSVEHFPQRYTRLATDRYRYESLDSGFTAELDVDELGLVVRYEGLFERATPFDPGSGPGS
jgi:hypothetical protein